MTAEFLNYGDKIAQKEKQEELRFWLTMAADSILDGKEEGQTNSGEGKTSYATSDNYELIVHRTSNITWELSRESAVDTGNPEEKLPTYKLVIYYEWINPVFGPMGGFSIKTTTIEWDGGKQGITAASHVINHRFTMGLLGLAAETDEIHTGEGLTREMSSAFSQLNGAAVGDTVRSNSPRHAKN